MEYTTVSEAVEALRNDLQKINKLLSQLPSSETDDVIMDVNEASKFLHIRPHTLHQWVSQRRIPFRKYIGQKRVLFSKNDLTEFLKNTRIKEVTYVR